MIDLLPGQIAAYYRARVAGLKKQGGEYRAPCPIHQGTDLNFSVNLDKGVWQCHSTCKRGGGVLDLEMELTGVATKAAAFKRVAKLLGIEEETGKAKPAGEAAKVVESDEYTDEHGHRLYRALRWEPGFKGRSKDFTLEAANGVGGWKKGPGAMNGVRRVPLNLPQVLDAQKVYIVEGERKARQLGAWGLVATCNAGGAGKWQGDDWAEYFIDTHVVIVPDNDAPGQKHMADVAQKLGSAPASIRRVEIPTGNDVVDWARAGATAAQFLALPELPIGDQPAAPVAEAAVPLGYELTETALYRINQETSEKVYLCDRLEVVGLTRDSRGEEWGRLLRFRDRDGRAHEFILRDELLASEKGEWRAALLRLGLKISLAKPAAEWLRHYLFLATPTGRWRKVDQTGWQGDIYVTPSWSLPEDTPEKIILDDQGEGDQYFKQAGTLESWRKQVAAKCPGNPLLMFCVSAAFAPPLLPLHHNMSGGFHLASGSSKGKTTSLVVAGSVWGGGGRAGFVRSWASTPSGIEALAHSHNHALLCLDELKELDPEMAGRMAYALAHGTGKSRANVSMRQRKSVTFELLFLSTGEYGFTAHIASGEKRNATGRAYGGQEVRVCEIPADRSRHGSFDALHGHDTAARFADAIRQAASENYGTAARAFVEGYLKQGRDQVKRRVAYWMEEFTKTNAPSGAAPEVGRVLNRFAFVAAAGELAGEWGITGWKTREASAAVGRCFKYWLEARGTVGSFDEKQALDHFKDYMLKFGPSQLQRHQNGAAINPDDRPLNKRIGFVNEPLFDAAKEYQFLEAIPPDVCGPFSEGTIIRALDNANALLKEGQRLKVKRKLPGFNAKVRCYVVSHDALYGGEE
jgi:putative DNA primase/helicase